MRRRFSGCDKNAEKNRKQKTTEFFDKLEESVLIRKSVSKMIMNLKNDTQIHKKIQYTQCQSLMPIKKHVKT